MSGSLEQSGNLTPNYPRDQETLWREIRKLWAGVNRAAKNRIIDMPFVWSGKLGGAAGDLSPAWLIPGGARLYKIFMTLGTAGTTTTTVGIYKNDVQITTISLGSGARITSTLYTEEFAPDTDTLRVAITVFGTGAQDLAVQVRLRAT